MIGRLSRVWMPLCLAVAMYAVPAPAQASFTDHGVSDESAIVAKQHPEPTIAPGSMAVRPARFPWDWRKIDGTENNPAHPNWGCARSELVRMCPQSYQDGAEMPAGAHRPSARAVSNAVAAQEQSIPNGRGLSDLFWQWGQFLDHDMTLVAVVDPDDPFDIPVPPGDPFFDPFDTGTEVIALNRSFFSLVDGIRE